jgi:uncharacterized repeat protein (TIGR01451 family)
MHRLKPGFFAVLLFAAFGAAVASARPVVVLKLEGDIVTRDSRGAEKLIAVADGAGFQPGQTVRYTIVASNKGADAALGLVPAARIPAGSAYDPGSASTSGALRVEFSLDGGKTWSAKPLVKVQTANGTVEKPADPSLYTGLRWIGAKALEPKSNLTYSYQVRIK